VAISSGNISANDYIKIGDAVFVADDVLKALKGGNVMATSIDVTAKLYTATVTGDKDGAVNAVADTLVILGATALGSLATPMAGLGLGTATIIGLNSVGGVTGLLGLSVTAASDLATAVVNTPDSQGMTLNAILNNPYLVERGLNGGSYDLR